MTRLHVEATAEATIAGAGNRNPASLAVIVSDERGAPVTGIGPSEVRIDAMIVGAGGVLVRVIGVSAGRLPGTYIAQVVPVREEIWRPGGYVFAVAIEHGVQRGMTLAHLRLP